MKSPIDALADLKRFGLAGELGMAKVAAQRGWEALKAIGWSIQKPRPHLNDLKARDLRLGLAHLVLMANHHKTSESPIAEPENPPILPNMKTLWPRKS